jgi:hypothetical protein
LLFFEKEVRVNVALKVSMEGDSSRELRFTLEPLHEAVDRGTWDKQQQNGIGVTPSNGYWSYVDYAGEIWLSESSDVFLGIRVDGDWSNSLIGGGTVMGQGWLQRSTEGDVNVLFSMEATS